jgi:hypothetical protein
MLNISTKATGSRERIFSPLNTEVFTVITYLEPRVARNTTEILSPTLCPYKSVTDALFPKHLSVRHTLTQLTRSEVEQRISELSH